jgi:hypothetical protein
MQIHEATSARDTGLFGELEDISQCSSNPSSRSQSPELEYLRVRKPVHSRSRKNSKRKRVLNRKEALCGMFKGYRIAQARRWQLEDSKRAETGFLGRHGLLCGDRLIVPKGTSPEAHIKALIKANYEKVVIRYVSKIWLVLSYYSMYSSDIPTLILDRWGTVVGVAAPPCKDKRATEEMTMEISNLIKFGTLQKDSKRGEFEILEHGVQMGPGNSVSSLF